MSKKVVYKPSNFEQNYTQVFSKKSVINAYASWMELSDIERQCLDMFLGADDRVLDLGCGVGRIPSILEQRFGSYLGIDCSSEMIDMARKLNPECKFLCEDILQPSFSERNFDVILLMNNVLDMLHPVERRQEVFHLVKGLLGHSGLLIYSSHLLKTKGTPRYYQEEYHGFSVNTHRSSFSQLCEEAESFGFEVKLATRDYRYQVADWAYIVASYKK